MDYNLNRVSGMKNNRGVLKVLVAYMAILSIFFMVMPPYVNALTSKDKYFIAESCYKKLKQDPSKQKFRDQWMVCIGKYQEVFKTNPNDPWAAAGLYMTGVLYHELFKMSGSPSDEREARDTFQRIIKRYPSSQYRQKAIEQLKNVASDKKNDVPAKTVLHNTTKDLPSDHEAIQRDESLDEIFQVADESIDLTAEKTQITHKRSLKAQTLKKLPSDQKKFTKSEELADSVLMSETDNNGGPKKSQVGGTTTVTGLRYWSNPNYTRLVIDANGDTAFEERLLKSGRFKKVE